MKVEKYYDVGCDFAAGILALIFTQGSSLKGNRPRVKQRESDFEQLGRRKEKRQ